MTTQSMGAQGWVATKWQRARTKSPRALIRTVMLRVWPFAPLTRFYFRARFWPWVWTRVLNRQCRTAYASAVPSLDATQERAIRDLNAKGITITHVDQFLGVPGAADRFRVEAQLMFSRPHIAQQIQRRRSEYGGKNYVIRAFGGGVKGDLTNALVELALNERVLATACRYLGMWPRLKYMDLWYNVPVDPNAKEVASQRWHRDYDDYRMVKLFLYVEAVDEQTGPFMFMPESQAGGRFGALYPSKPPSGSDPPEGAVERAIGPNAAIVCTGPAGTLVLADTAGFHKGGRAIARPRIMFTATYASDASVEVDRYRLSDTMDYSALGPLGRFAIRADR